MPKPKKPTTPDLDLGETPDIGDLDFDLDDIPDPLAPDPEPVADPLAAVEYTDNLEEDSARELSALEQGIRDRAAAERDRFREATDTEYWFAVCFRTREDKEAFLERYDLYEKGDKYLLGPELDKAIEKHVAKAKKGKK